MTLLAVFNSLNEAHLACAYLRSLGFSPYIPDENTLSVNPFYNQALGGVRMLIHEAEKEVAADALDEYSGLHLSSEAFSLCPSCNSNNILKDPITAKEYFAHFRCFDCDYVWDDRCLKNINPGHIE